MQTFLASRNRLGLLVDLHADKILYVATIAGALAAGGAIGLALLPTQAPTSF
jgi:hypothetical protein